MRIVIRDEKAEDAAAVDAVNTAAFAGPVEARIVERLRGSDGSLSLVALVNGRLAGHVLFTPVRIDPKPGDIRVAGLAPVAVLPELQRQGIGSALIKEGLDRCRALGYVGVVVVGHPDYYPRFGFVAAQAKGLQYEHPVPPEVFMVLELEPDALDGVTGVVHYRPEFYIE